MTMYEVITKFADLEDGKHLYNEGDAFPRAGMTVSKRRIQQLLGSNNSMRKPIIRESSPSPSVALEQANAGVTPPDRPKAKGKPRKKKEKA